MRLFSHIQSPLKRFNLPIFIGVVILAIGRAPFFWSDFGHDQAGYMYMGKVIANGGVPFLDIWDHKNPGLSYIYSIVYRFGGESIATFRFVEFLWLAVTIVLFALLVKQLFKKASPTALGICVVYFSLMLAHIDFGTIDGGGYTESYLLLPNLLAVLLLLKYEKVKRPLIPIGIGVLLFFSFMIKQSVLLIVVPFLYFFLATLYKKTGDWKQAVLPVIKTWSQFSLGFFLPLVLLIVYFYFVGAIPAFIDNTITFNTLYGGGVTVLTKFLGSVYIAHNYTLGFPITYLLFVFGMIVLVTKRTTYSYLLIVWFIADIIGITSTNKFYGHYYIQVFPVLALIASAAIALLYDEMKNLLKQQRSLVIIAAVPLFFLLFIPYISNPSMAYINKWSELRRNVIKSNIHTAHPEMLAYVEEHSDPDDFILIWDSAQIYIYLMTNTWSPSSYFHGIPFSETHAPGYATNDHWLKFKSDVKKNRPKIILINETTIQGLKANPIMW